MTSCASSDVDLARFVCQLAHHSFCVTAYKYTIVCYFMNVCRCMQRSDYVSTSSLVDWCLTIHLMLQIWKVEPVNQIDDRFGGKQVSHRIRSFFLTNDVNTFTYHRRLSTNAKDSDFGSLWLERTTVTTRSSLPGILRWSQIETTTTTQVSPIQSAIETLHAKNDDIYRLVEKYLENPSAEMDPQMASVLGGVVDPAVNGGISNYEKAFFTPNYLDSHTSSDDREKIDALKDLIANQVPLLEAAFEVYNLKVKDGMRPFYAHIYECFQKQKSHVETSYGVRQSIFPKLVPKPTQPQPAARSYSNVEIRKNGSFVSYDIRLDSGNPPSVNGSSRTSTLSGKKNPLRSAGSLSTLSLRGNF